MQVYVSPTLTRVGSNRTEELGSSVWLDCVADGVPEPLIDWYFDGLPMNKSWETYVPFSLIQ